MKRAGLLPSNRALSVAGLVLTGCLLTAAWLQPRVTLHAWYVATLFWTGLALGSLVTLMVHHLTSGRWGAFLRPLLRAATATLPFVLLAYLPLLLSMDTLFPWTKPASALAESVQKKTAYLNVPFFSIRAGIYAVTWVVLAVAFGAAARSADERRRGLAAIGLILYGLSITFYGVDWVHSLEPTFYSSAVGYLIASGQFVAALAFATLIAVLLAPREQRRAEAPPWNDLGNLLLAAVMLWAYIAFTKYLIIWMADLPHEIEWYVRRQEGAWFPATVLLVLLHFVLPFVLLLFRRIKQSPSWLGGVAGLLLAAHLLEVSWLVLPSFGARPVYAGLVDLLAVAALGAWWLVAFLTRLEAATPAHGQGKEALRA